MTDSTFATVLTRLQQTIAARRLSSPDESYVAHLLSAAPEKPLKKIAEESAELIMAAKDLSALLAHSCAIAENTAQDERHQAQVREAKSRLIAEAADLQFHLQVMLAYYNVGLAEVAEALQRREGMSGHQEKALRQKN